MKTPYTLTSPAMPYTPSVLIDEVGRYGWHSYIEVSRLNDGDTEFTYRILSQPHDTLARWTGEPESFVSLPALDAARKQFAKNERTQKRVVRNGHKTPAYIALLPIYKRVVKHYHRDFTWHDAMLLGSQEIARLVWAVSDSGTHIYWMNSIHSRQCLQYLAKNNSGMEFWYYDGNTLQQFEPAHILDYVQKLPREKD